MSSQSPRIGFVFRTKKYCKKPTQDTRLLKDIIHLVKGKVQPIIIDLNAVSLEVPHFNHEKKFNIICSMSRDPIILSLLSVYEIFGTPVINSVRSVWISNNIPSIFALIAKEGIPTPSTNFIYSVSKIADSNKLLKKHKVLKRRGSGLKTFSKTDSLSKKLTFHQLDSNGLNVIQEFIKADLEIKAYVIGRQVFLKNIKNSCCSSPFKKILCRKLLSKIEESAIQIGKLSGLEIFNVDILIKDSQFYVVDINDFPSFEGIAKAAEKISSYIMQKAVYY